MNKLVLKNWLLQKYAFIQNEYFDQYIDLLINYDATTVGYREKHHSLPVSYYKDLYNCRSRRQAVTYADNDTENLKISLRYKDHCKAHVLLYFCTTGRLKAASCETVSYIANMYMQLINKKKRFDFVEADFEIYNNIKILF